MVATSDILASAHLAGASPLLTFLAGEFAGPVSHVWRAPHEGFLALPAARRHAAGLVFAGLARAPIAGADLRRLLEFGRDGAIADMLAGDAARGLMRLLAKLGEVMWTAAEYRTLVDLFAEPAASEALRHLDQVRPDRLKLIAPLPIPLRTSSVLRVLTSEAEAMDLALAFRLARAMRSPEAMGRLAERWTSGGDIRALFIRAREDLIPEAFIVQEAAPKLAGAFEAVTTLRRLSGVALEFRNCLVDHAPRVSEGRIAIFVWRIEPPAVIALAHDAAGWRLAEAKAADNQDLEETDLRTLVTHLAGHKVRTGPSLEALRRRLDDHAFGHGGHAQPVGYAARLELGDLWS